MYAIEAKNISKDYRIYAKPSDRLKELLIRKPCHQLFSALKDVSFSLLPGRAIGIIGNNGAGKSTLLKIIAGTLRPTSGTLSIQGRSAAILDLGAGFHMEFTGRQNIYLNASLLGLKPEEIRQREGSIIEFAELQDFIDRPVKTYSSGMYIRLAFSIATSIDPEILIIDEALSVGDQRFQKKCIDRMAGFRNQGKTILFCSHSMYHVSELCDTAVWISRGGVQEIGERNKVISAYERWCQRAEEERISHVQGRETSPVRIEEVTVIDGGGKSLQTFRQRDDIRVRIHVESREPRTVHIGVGFRGASGENVFGVTTKSDAFSPFAVEGKKIIVVDFPCIHLLSGAYQAFGVVLDEHALHVYDLKLSQMIDVRKDSDMYGMFYMEHRWNL